MNSLAVLGAKNEHRLGVVRYAFHPPRNGTSSHVGRLPCIGRDGRAIYHVVYGTTS